MAPCEVLGRFRLFFRFSTAHRAIIYAWLNDASTLRKAGAPTDPYTVFKRRLDAGDPPGDWDLLLAAANEKPFRLKKMP